MVVRHYPVVVTVHDHRGHVESHDVTIGVDSGSRSCPLVWIADRFAASKIRVRVSVVLHLPAGFSKSCLVHVTASERRRKKSAGLMRSQRSKPDSSRRRRVDRAESNPNSESSETARRIGGSEIHLVDAHQRNEIVGKGDIACGHRGRAAFQRPDFTVEDADHNQGCNDDRKPSATARRSTLRCKVNRSLHGRCAGPSPAGRWPTTPRQCRRRRAARD